MFQVYVLSMVATVVLRPCILLRHLLVVVFKGGYIEARSQVLTVDSIRNKKNPLKR